MAPDLIIGDGCYVAPTTLSRIAECGKCPNKLKEAVMHQVNGAIAAAITPNKFFWSPPLQNFKKSSRIDQAHNFLVHLLVTVAKKVKKY